MKPLLILSLLAALAGVGMQFALTLNGIKKSRIERDATDRETAADEKKRSDIIKELDGEGGIYAVTTERMKVSLAARLDTNNLATEKKNEDAKLKEAEDKIKALQDERKEIEDKINAAIGQIGGSLEELTAKLESLKQENEAKATEVEGLKKELTEMQALATAADQKEAALNKQQAERNKAIALAASSGTITAVNPEWSFCVLNMGQKQGVTTDSRLIVKRGAQFIGRLNIIQINQGQTVADIDTKTLVAGQSVNPGDQVIFETSAQ